MKSISVHVNEDVYREFKVLASRSGRPVAELIREAMGRYLEAPQRVGPSFLLVPPHPSGRARGTWTREEIFEEMIGP